MEIGIVGLGAVGSAIKQGFEYIKKNLFKTWLKEKDSI
tara:strand:+ start:369 stop:482 length:114 start_codon:yes stop_codon:yes gene_type:complete